MSNGHSLLSKGYMKQKNTSKLIIRYIAKRMIVYALITVATMFALSDPEDEAFQVKCAHQHTLVCDSCENLKSTLEELGNKLKHNRHFSYTEDIKEELKTELTNGRRTFSVR